jgi:hypothetical protein
MMGQHDLASAYSGGAFEMIGSTMEPRHWEGDTLHTDVRREATKGDSVVVELTDGTIAVGEFCRRGRRSLVISTLNPRREIRLRASQVLAVKVVSTTWYAPAKA